MPDQLTDDNLAELFADLRADAMPRVLPPGVADVRRTVRRRRRQTVSVVAGIAILAGAGGLTLAGLPGATPAATIADQPAPRPTYEGWRPQAYGTTWDERAAEAVGLDRFAPGLGGQADLRGGTRLARPAVGGQYEFQMTCVGKGRVTVTIQAGARTADGALAAGQAAVVAERSIPCTQTATVDTAAVTVPQPDGMFTVDVQPDAAATERAAFAYAVKLSEADRHRLTESANAVADRGRSLGDLQQAATMFMDDSRVHLGPDFEPGRYLLHAACAGRGTIKVTVLLDPDSNPSGKGKTKLGDGTLTCWAEPRLVELPFTMRGSKSVGILLEPDDEAREQSGAAFVVTYR